MRIVIFMIRVKTLCGLISTRYIILISIREGSTDIDMQISQTDQASSRIAYDALANEIQAGGNIAGMDVASS